jgi:hypothetical protein
VRHQRSTLGVRDGFGDYAAALSLHHSEDRGLVGMLIPATTLSTTATLTVVGLVHLNRTGERRPAVFGQHLADFVEHAPRGLVGNAKLSLQLLGRDAATGLGHQEDSVEPKPKRG